MHPTSQVTEESFFISGTLGGFAVIMVPSCRRVSQEMYISVCDRVIPLVWEFTHGQGQLAECDESALQILFLTWLCPCLHLERYLLEIDYRAAGS